LLENRDKKNELASTNSWHRHNLWPEIETFLGSREQERAQQTGESRRAESRRMRLLLALSHMESIIESS